MDTIALEEIPLKPPEDHIKIDILTELPSPPPNSRMTDGVDGKDKRSFWSKVIPKSAEEKREESFASKKTAAEGMMDIALLTANANQLRFLFAYNAESKTYYMSVSLIIASLILQVAVGVTLIFKVRELPLYYCHCPLIDSSSGCAVVGPQRQMKNKGRRASWTNDFLVVGVFLVTVINVFAASFTTTHSPTASPAHTHAHHTTAESVGHNSRPPMIMPPPPANKPY